MAAKDIRLGTDARERMLHGTAQEKPMEGEVIASGPVDGKATSMTR